MLSMADVCGRDFTRNWLKIGIYGPFQTLSGVDRAAPAPYVPRLMGLSGSQASNRISVMKVLNSLKSAKKRDKNCVIVRRKGRVYVINKRNPRFKARQG